jgi:predicted TPR repeat methyltransferase
MEISLDDAYSLKSPEDNQKLYAKWADTYESDFVENQGYEHPRVIAEIFHSKVPEVNSVIDIGTGTGLVGFNLSNIRNGINIDGVDISKEMLDVARKKGIYRNLYIRDLTKAVSGTEAPYDALICIGIFTHGHLSPSALDNLLPLVKSNGFLVIGINSKYFKSENFSKKFHELTSSKTITAPVFQETRVYKEDSEHRDSLNIVAIFQKS